MKGAVSVLVALVTLWLLTACSAGERRVPDYTPVPDRVLFERAAQVDGVDDAELSYNSTLGDRGYDGEVTLKEGLTRAAAGEAVSSIYAILRQGRYSTPIGLSIYQGDEQVDQADLPGVPLVGTTDQLLEFYGPQPGNGTPPPR